MDDDHTPQTENERRKTATGANLRAAREAVGLTQPDVAKAIKRTQSAVSDWERGVRMPGIFDLDRLADLYGVTTDDLLDVGELVGAGAD